MAAMLRELNRHALISARIGGPLAAAASAVAYLATSHTTFAAASLIALALGLSSHMRLKADNLNAEFVIAAAGVNVVLMWPVAPDVIRGGLSAALVVLAMLGFLVLPARARRRTVVHYVVLLSAQLVWPLFGMATVDHVVVHVGLSLGYLAVGLVGTGVARATLERSERTRLEVFRRVPTGLLRVSRAGLLIEVNPAFAGMLGYQPAELVGRPVADLYEDAGPLIQLANRLGVSTHALRYAHRLARKDGTSIWVRGYVQPVRDDSGEMIYYEGAVEDVTQRREMEERSRVNAERFRNVFEMAPIAIWEEDWTGVGLRLEELRTAGVTDLGEHLNANPDVFMEIYEHVKYLDVNPAGMALVGAATKEQAFANTRPPAPPSPNADSFIAEFTAIWDDLDHMTLEAHGHRVGGDPVNLSISWAATRDPQGRLDLSHIIVAMIDISDVKRAERDLAALVASKDELVASVSHELRTPITTIMGMAFEMRDHAESFSPKESVELIGLIADQSRELSNIVEDLLVAARSDLETLAVRPEAIVVGDEVDQIVASTSPGVMPTIDIAGDVVAWADPLRFRQIIRNLLSNARRYGGRQVRIEATTAEGQVIVRVRDNGAGVASGDEEAIFEPYVRSSTDEGLPGSIGLGLPVSRRLARLMDGDLTYSYDGGTVFEVRLPIADRAAVSVG